MPQIAVHPRSFNFTNDDWNLPRRVEIVAVDDDVAEETLEIEVQHEIHSNHESIGDKWHFVSDLSAVSVRVYDDDVAEVQVSILSHTSRSTGVATEEDQNNNDDHMNKKMKKMKDESDEEEEDQSRTIFAVSLGSQPTSNVVLRMHTRTGVPLLTDPLLLVFTPDSWTATQTFTVVKSSMDSLELYVVAKEEGKDE
jgi:hypothetical protein